MAKPIAVGRTDNDYLPARLSGINKAVKQRRFNTVTEAEAFIGNVALADPTGVKAGDYYIDVPEQLQKSGD